MRQVAVRTWKRDGTINVMDLKAGVENLAWHLKRAKLGPADIQEKLLAGEQLETPRATFRLDYEEGGFLVGKHNG